MNLVAKIIAHKNLILIFFCVAALVCAFLQAGVQVNYNLADYLPRNAPSTVALEIMQEEFTRSIPNARVFVPDITLVEALHFKQELAKIPGVEHVLWLDDVINVYEPLAMADPETVDAWYKNGDALFTVTLTEENIKKTLEHIYALVGEKGAVSGQAVDLVAAQTAAEEEVKQVMLFFVPLIILILLLATSSWLEPLLFLATLGISILINMGTNIFFGEISFITQAVSPVLQLAVSMDYAIFLLARFAQFRQEGLAPPEAMKQAVSKAAPTIVASAVTTVFGFLALIFMQFAVGPDMGVVMAKGIVLSLLSVLVFLPALTLSTYKLLEKTRHRPLMPSFAAFSNFVTRLGVPLFIIIGFLIIPSFLAQKQNHFIYGAGDLGQSGRPARDAKLIEENFGKLTQLVLMVPRDNWGKEKMLTAKLQEIPQVVSVTSYDELIGAEIPPDFLPAGEREQFISPHYSRIMIDTNTVTESAAAFSVVEQVRNLAAAQYGSHYHLLGPSVNIYDIKETVTADSTVVNGIAILAIGLVLLLGFRSLSLPFILLLTIEGAIWMNLAIPYFLNTSLNYIGFLIISSVQLGATVDYGILYTHHYLDNRKVMPKKAAGQKALQETTASILTPAGILFAGGLILYLISTNSIVKELGLVLGRGALLSAFMVLLFLPNLLLLCDGLIGKTTLLIKLFKSGSEETCGK
ncbi:MAG: MMPL family transporter [Firmicutes bacterium]|nr:MMPL family transporter [Bacillota bacterium]